MRPLLLRPPFFVSGSSSVFSGSVFVTSSKVGDGHEAAARARRLVLAYGISHSDLRALEDLDRLARRAAGRSPSSSRALCPAMTPRRFGFACTLTMFTPSTLTSKSSSTAWRICVLCASVCTLNVYLRSVDQRVALLRDDRSEQDLVRMKTHRSPLPCDERQRRLGDEHRARPRRPRATSSSAGTVTSTRSRLRNDLTSVSSSSVATTSSGALAPVVEQPASRPAGRRFVERAGVEERERAGLRVDVESAPRSAAAARLAVDLDVEARASSAGRRRRRP